MTAESTIGTIQSVSAATDPAIMDMTGATVRRTNTGMSIGTGSGTGTKTAIVKRNTDEAGTTGNLVAPATFAGAATCAVVAE
jgi:hypothetical protein